MIMNDKREKKGKRLLHVIGDEGNMMTHSSKHMGKDITRRTAEILTKATTCR